MNRKSTMVIGLLSILTVTGVVNASSSIASDAGQAAVTKRIGHGGSTYPVEPERIGDCRVKVNLDERIGAGGSIYASGHSFSARFRECRAQGEVWRQVDISERIGAGGSTYSSSTSPSTKS